MASSLFPNKPQQNSPFEMFNKFKEFAKGVTPQQAEETIKKKLESGEISKQQFENLVSQAKRFGQMFGLK